MIAFFILIILYYIYQYFTCRFWFQFSKSLPSGNFYIGELDPSISISKPSELEKLENLYKQYMVPITKKEIANYCKNPNFSAIYKKNGHQIIASVFNFIYSLTNGKKINYVDAAIIDKKYRNCNIFNQLMPYVSKNTVDNCADYIVFKIDGQPIPTFRNYKFISKNYVLPFKNIEEDSSGVKDFQFSQKINNYYKFQLFFTKEMLEDKICLQSGETVAILKRHSDKNLELLYIFWPEKKSVKNIIAYCKKYKTEYLSLDNIGDNSLLTNWFPFSANYDSYHYILGYNDSITKEQFMC